MNEKTEDEYPIITREQSVELYAATNDLMTLFSMNGEIDPYGDECNRVMDALHDIDGGFMSGDL